MISETSKDDMQVVSKQENESLGLTLGMRLKPSILSLSIKGAK